MPGRETSTGRPRPGRTVTARLESSAEPVAASPTPWWPIALLGAVVASVYANSLHGAFIFDDYSCLVANPSLRTLWPLTTTVATPPDTALAGRPAVTLTFALNYALHGLSTWGYHAVNVALHLANALLAFGIIHRTLAMPRWREHFGDRARSVAAAVALLWAAHPLLTESVTYIVQRTELLMSLGLLMTLYATIRTVEAPRSRWPIVAVASCAVGMASKEVTAVAPLLVWLYDALLVSTSWSEPWRRRRALYLGLAATWLILAALVAGGHRQGTAGFHLALSPWDYLKTQCGVLVHYLRLATWPYPLVSDYGDWPVATSWAQVWPAAVVVGAWLATTLWLCGRRSPLALLAAWPAILLAPTSSVLPIATELMAERRMYLPLLALVAAAVLAGDALLRRLPADRRARASAGASIVAALTLILGAATIRRNADYASEARLLEDVIAKRPRNARAMYNLGVAVAEQGRFGDAAMWFERAIDARPGYADAYNNLGAALVHLGQRDAAIAHYREAIRLDPSLPEPHNNLHALMAEPSNRER